MIYCTFCGKDEEEVKCLITGPGPRICDECVEECMRIVQEHRMRVIFDYARAVSFEELWGTDV